MAERMLTEMKQDFKIFYITGGAYSELVDFNRTTVVSDYSLLENKNKNEYDSTVTELLGNDAVNQWLKNLR